MVDAKAKILNYAQRNPRFQEALTARTEAGGLVSAAEAALAAGEDPAAVAQKVQAASAALRSPRRLRKKVDKFARADEADDAFTLQDLKRRLRAVESATRQKLQAASREASQRREYERLRAIYGTACPTTSVAGLGGLGRRGVVANVAGFAAIATTGLLTLSVALGVIGTVNDWFMARSR